VAWKRRTLIIRGWNAGFFSNFNGVINNLHHRLGRRGIAAAVVDWRAGEEPSQLPYGRPEDGNLWLHFFEPLSFDGFPGRTLKATGFAAPGMTGRCAYAMYRRDRNWRREYNAVYRQHVRVKPSILDQVEEVYRSRMQGHYCAGVHYRHPLHDSECLHPIAEPEIFVSRLRQLLPNDRPWVVFLATDVEPVVEIFRRAFGARLVLQPGVRRSATAKDVSLHERGGTSDLATAREVLIDCLLLARCDLLLHVTSNVATAVGYINPALRMVYCETEAQAAWGRMWSICFGRPWVDWLIWWPPLAIRAALRRSRNGWRRLTGQPLIPRPAAQKRAPARRRNIPRGVT
jgi:hypothetical protein